jgi:hypothetical protein
MLHATESTIHHGRCDYQSQDKETSDKRLNDRIHGHEHDLEVANSFGDEYGGSGVVAAATAEEEDVTAILMMGSGRVALAIR